MAYAMPFKPLCDMPRCGKRAALYIHRHDNYCVGQFCIEHAKQALHAEQYYEDSKFAPETIART